MALSDYIGGTSRSIPQDSNKVSTLAIFETVLAFCGYSYLAVTFGVFWPLWLSLFVVPMVLMKSPASANTATRMWKGFVDGGNLTIKSDTVLYVTIFFSALLQGYITYRLLENTHLAIQIFIMPFLVLALPVFDDILIRLFRIDYRSIDSTKFVFLPPILATCLLMSPLSGVLGIPILFYLTGKKLGIPRLDNFMRRTVFRGGPLFSAVVTIETSVGEAIGLLLRFVLTRFISVFLHIPSGLRSLPQNWREVTLQNDVLAYPKPFPGSKALAHLTPDMWVRAFNEDLPNRIGGAVIVLVIYGPAYIYRFTIKSSVWFFLPLIFVFSKGGRSSTETREALVAQKRADAMEWFGFLGASCVIGVSMATLFGGDELSKVLAQVTRTDIAFASMTWIFVLDWSQLTQQPWRWLSLLNSVIVILLFLRLSRIRGRRRSNPARYPADGLHVRSLDILGKVSLVLFILYWLVAIYYLTDYALAQGKLQPVKGFAELIVKLGDFVARMNPIAAWPK